MENLEYDLGYIVEMKKEHPCDSNKQAQVRRLWKPRKDLYRAHGSGQIQVAEFRPRGLDS